MSSSVTLGVGDAIAMALMGVKCFTKDEFSRNHPGGNLGKLLNAKIRDVMVKGDEIPALAPNTSFLDAIAYMACKRLGFVVVVDSLLKPLGVLSDEDMSKVLKAKSNILDLKVSDVMEVNLKPVYEEESIGSCINHNASAILVVDHEGRLLGVSHKNDLAI